METEFVAFISQFGFPIAVSVYFIIMGNKTIAKNTEALLQLKTAIENMKKEK